MNTFSNPNNQWKRFTLLRLFAFLIISFSPNTIANPLKDYCLSKTEPEETLREVRTEGLSSSWSKRLKVNLNGENYIVLAEDNLQLIREKDNLIIKERSIWEFLQKDEFINSLYITKNGWLFIDADKNNYIAPLLFGDSVRLGMPVPVSKDKFYEEKCTRLDKWFYACSAPYINYSSVLDRVFVSGYRETTSGQHWSTIELIGYKEKVLPFPKPMTSYLGDSVALNGAFFKSDEDEVFFYDGNKIVKLSISVESLVRDIPKFNGVLFRVTQDEIFF